MLIQGAGGTFVLGGWGRARGRAWTSHQVWRQNLKLDKGKYLPKG